MSYVKPTKVVADASIGFRTVNDLAASQLDTKTLLELEHAPISDPDVTTGMGDIGGGAAVGNAADVGGGEHDTPKVARGTMTVVIDPAWAFGSPTARILTKSGVCKDLVRLAAGSYIITVDGLSDLYADVTAAADDNTVTRLVQAFPASAASGEDQAGIQGVFVSTWQEATLVSSNKGFTLTEFGFHVVVYGRRGDTFDPGAEGFPWPEQARRQDRRRHPRSRVFFVKL